MFKIETAKTLEIDAEAMRALSADEVNAVAGAGIFDNTGCILINRWAPLPKYNPWLDPYSPERRGL